MALVGTLVHHRSAAVRAKATRMFSEIAGAHGICPEVHYPVPEFATVAGDELVYHIPWALAALRDGALQPHRVPQGGPRPAAVTPRLSRHAVSRQAATTRHMPLDSAAHNALARAPGAAPALPGQQRLGGLRRCGYASTSAPMSTFTTAVAHKGPPTTPGGARPWSTCSTPQARGTPA